MGEGGVEMESTSVRKRQRPFVWVMLGCVLFPILTTVAMFLYPGGTRNDPATNGYQFFANFFSDLGITVAHDGSLNTPCAALFFSALMLGGLAVILFFVTMAQFFRQPHSVRVLSWIGSLVGVVSGLAYVGIAFTPGNLFLDVHILFVQLAFLCFFLAVLLYMVAILVTKSYPNRYAAVLAGFAVILAVYLWLLFFGPAADTSSGLTIQATGQKIVVYAMIVTVFIEAHGARRLTTGVAGNRPEAA
jgi:hypothetical protein